MKKNKTPEERYEEAAFELAIYDLMRHAQTAADIATENELGEIEHAAKKSMPAMLKMIDKNILHIAIKTQFATIGALSIKVAIAAVLITNLALSIAVATSPTVRAGVIEFLISMNDSYVELSFANSKTMIEIPKGWNADYFPTHQPENYRLQHYSTDDQAFGMLLYVDDKGHYIEIDIHGADSASRINVQDASISEVPVCGTTATVLRQANGDTYIFWTLGTYYFVVSGNAPYETILAVAESMTPIEK